MTLSWSLSLMDFCTLPMPFSPCQWQGGKSMHKKYKLLALTFTSIYSIILYVKVVPLLAMYWCVCLPDAAKDSRDRVSKVQCAHKGSLLKI